MRNYLKALAVLFIISGCHDEKKDIAEKGYSLYCWPSKTACDNKEYGIEVSYYDKIIQIRDTVVEVSERRIATMICCRYVEEIIDSLTLYNDLLIEHRENGGSFSRTCRIGDFEVYGGYSSNWDIKPTSSGSLGIKDLENPYDFELRVPQFEHFKAFRDDIMAMYKKCCLREGGD